MRYTTAYYLLLIYVTVTIKPLLPLISDTWSHEFNEIEHLSTVHAKYGSHHLQKELAETNSDCDRSKNSNTLKSEDQVPFHIVSPQCECDFIKNKSSVQYHSFTLHKLPVVCLLNQAPPPKFS